MNEHKIWTPWEIHEVAKSKGWWEGERNYGEVFANIYSELGEAAFCLIQDPDPSLIKEVYLGDSNETAVKFKPEGFLIELADVAIRIMDFLGYRNSYVVSRREYAHLLYGIGSDERMLHARLSYVSIHLSMAWEFYRDHSKSKDTDNLTLRLGAAIKELEMLIYHCSSDHPMKYELDYLIDKKMKYNLTRPYRHGGKKA